MKPKTLVKQLLLSLGLGVAGLVLLFLLFQVLPLNLYREWEMTHRDPEEHLVIGRSYWRVHRDGGINRVELGQVTDGYWVGERRYPGPYYSVTWAWP